MDVMVTYAVVRGADLTPMHLDLLMKQEQHGTQNQCWKRTFTKYLYLRFSVKTYRLKEKFKEKKTYENN